MKKRSLKNLSLKKTTVSNLETGNLQGGKAASKTLWHSIIVCVTRWTNEDCESMQCPIN
ncbi:hypothetical protein IMCC3317_45640 [Kordia antarctica]|uniref:Uncharacterized protein n=1 Tax=Kordia antarctica TaxID=1218801 RepID=A0A7L4ZRC2_9FLAO|nr:hypothetical protein [Kordia antarctica]QHI39162.1 hypothetical protein IMCC3317_45640 [Kordia antarctica]